MAKRKHTRGSAVRTIAEIGFGVGAIAAATGAYFLSGPKGKRRRAVVRSWGLKMKGDVLEEVERLKKLGERQYREIIDGVATRYRALREVDPKELEIVVRELKGHWRNIRRDMDRAIERERAKRPAKGTKRARRSRK